MRNFKILLSVLVLMQMVFTGCEKYNEPASVENIQTKNSVEKGFEVIDPVLVDKQHYDGNVGCLYLDKYDKHVAYSKPQATATALQKRRLQAQRKK